MTHLTSAHPRFADALRQRGLGGVEIRSFPEGTRTAVEAANAVGCALDQIVKSLVFEVDGVPWVVLTGGASRVDVELVRAECGAHTVRQATAETVRTATGYAIGGVPPFGHATALPVLADQGLLAHERVWAAAGTPHTVFAVPPRALVAYADARLAGVRELSEPEPGLRAPG